MLTVRIIPCLDCQNGRVVKGVKFQNLRDAGSPSELAQYYEDLGADELVLLDVAATPEGRGHQLETVEKVRLALGIPLTVGGGISTLSDVQALLNAGADKVSINTAAIKNPPLITEIAQQFGSQCTVVAIDANQAGQVIIRSGTELTPLRAQDWAVEATRLGAGEILLTSLERDGTQTGYDLALIREISNLISVPLIASGGAAGPIHFLQALEAGADAVLAASIFHDGLYSIGTVKRLLAESGIRVRL